MSNFIRKTKNPVSGKWEEATWLDGYFGKREYGVRFENGRIFREKEIKEYKLNFK